MTTELAKFLRARLDEDEQAARDAYGNQWIYDDRTGYVGADESSGYRPVALDVADHDGPHIARHDPARVLEEINAKQQLMLEAATYVTELVFGDSGSWAFDRTLRLLALPYADHADYQHEWRP